MLTKFNLGEDIHVEFIGKITNISLTPSGETVYSVVFNTKDFFSTVAQQVRESMMARLPLPEDFEVK